MHRSNERLARATVIAAQNDAFRRRPLSAAGRLMITRGIAAMAPERIARIVRAVVTFDGFNRDNDPWLEHDCATFTEGDDTFIWKFDYFADANLTEGAEDGASCYRVLTIMLATEY